jgi:hypothetical protein
MIFIKNMNDDARIYEGTEGSPSLDLHLSHHSTEGDACFSLLLPWIRTNEWPEGKAILVARPKR